MTVIAWDGVTLAADKRMTMGCHINTVTKIYRAGGWLFGFSGSVKYMRAFLDWVDSGMDPAKFPSVPEADDRVYALGIRSDRTIWKFEGTPWPIEIEDGCASSGSGRDYARAAMHLGKTAREAVEIACVFDENCGNGVDELSFDANPSEETGNHLGGQMGRQGAAA